MKNRSAFALLIRIGGLTTSRNKEGINIENTDIPHLYVESHIQSDIIQMAGRIRDGVEHMYIILDSQDNHSPEWRNEADFCREELATSCDSNGSTWDSCNDYLEKLCIRNNINKLYNCSHDAENTVFDRAKRCAPIAEYVKYIHDKFPYIRYSYLDNVFRFYQMRDTSRAYQAQILRLFKDAAAQPARLQQIVQNWFPDSKVHPFVTTEEARKRAADAYLESIGAFDIRTHFTREERDAMLAKLNEIYGTEYTSLNCLLKKKHLLEAKQCSNSPDREGYNIFRIVPIPAPKTSKKKAA